MVRDPVFGDISFTENERKVIDCPEVQRLRGVKQLGTAYLVYPGATHTRFDHSLGTSFLTKKMIHSIIKSGFEIDNETEELVAIAGLIHDISHVPFGHTFEDERKIFPRHDKYEYFKNDLSKGQLGDFLKQLGIKEKLLAILIQKDPTMKKGIYPWLGQIINDTICADLLDYIRRDCYYTGINKNYDDRVFSYFIVEEGKLVLNFVKNKMERSDARSEILHLLRLRYFLTERVYFHHAKLSSGAMISKAVELAVKESLLTRDSLYNLDDWTLFYYLKNCETAKPKNSPIKTLIERVERRQLLKRSYVLSSATLSARKSRDEFIKKFNPPTPEREQIEDMIIDRLQKTTKNNTINKSDVIIHCLSSSSLKEAEVLIKNVDGKLTQLNIRPHPAADVKSIEDAYEDLWRMYVFADAKYAKDVAKICEETFGRENEYSPKNW
ncbi:MAG TPA: HD domain-containing protein [candidate division Zixibacteria bacterium]|nr:HD domain-containing protein [candidate division Zixibacteria bacterium]